MRLCGTKAFAQIVIAPRRSIAVRVWLPVHFQCCLEVDDVLGGQKDVYVLSG